MGDRLTEALVAVCGAEHVLTDPELCAGFEADWTRRFRGRARFVVRPGSTSEVCRVLAACHAAGVAVVPQGGNTGLVGGGVPLAGEGVLSLRRLTTIEDFDPLTGEVTAGAGVTAAQLGDYARPFGLRLGVDLASRASATIGGMVATNAGGINVLRYGMMRAQVAGVEAVLADGRVVDRLSGLRRDNSGYDLAGLLAGSEGTLAVITRVRLRLVRDNAERAVVLLGVESAGEAVRIAAEVRAATPSLLAAEGFVAHGLDLVLRHTGLPAPFGRSYPWYVLFEAADASDPLPALAEAVERAAPMAESAAAVEPRARARLWAYRERHTEAISAAGVPHKLDVALPLQTLPEFADRVAEVAQAADPRADVVLFGHIADGNLHVNVLGLPEDDERVDEAVLRFVAGLGGSISAEHGIGTAKKHWLHLTRGPADIAAMRALKSALDPRRILNPNALFEA
ncbi:MAG: FAD-binding oxidoreductase [Dehalococcoidia bacterium]